MAQTAVASPPGNLRATVGTFVGLAGVTLGITMLYLGMRAVMQIGGFCAEGGPFVIETPCPKGIPAVMLGGIWGGIIFAAIYVWHVLKYQVPHLIGLLWSALFLSLGWNFLEFGLDPPGPPGIDTGVAWSWLICGFVFFAMGGLPLVAALPFTIREFTRSDPPSPGPGGIGPLETTAATLKKIREATAAVRSKRTSTPRREPTQRPEEEPTDVIGELERLDTLHRSGALTDAEYAAAKKRVLGI